MKTTKMKTQTSGFEIPLLAMKIRDDIYLEAGPSRTQSLDDGTSTNMVDRGVSGAKRFKLATKQKYAMLQKSWFSNP